MKKIALHTPSEYAIMVYCREFKGREKSQLRDFFRDFPKFLHSFEARMHVKNKQQLENYSHRMVLAMNKAIKEHEHIKALVDII